MEQWREDSLLAGTGTQTTATEISSRSNLFFGDLVLVLLLALSLTLSYFPMIHDSLLGLDECKAVQPSQPPHS